MDEIMEMRFGEADDVLLLSFKGRLFPDSKDFWDANWLGLSIRVQAGAFSGEVSGAIRNVDLGKFYDELQTLYENLQGKAKLVVELRLSLTIEADKQGHIHIYGSVDDADIDNNSLHFNFHTDQSYLPSSVQQLKKILAQYPILFKSE